VVAGTGPGPALHVSAAVAILHLITNCGELWQRPIAGWCCSGSTTTGHATPDRPAAMSETRLPRPGVPDEADDVTVALLSFLAAATLIIVAPGPDSLLVTRNVCCVHRSGRDG
jgi:hypothetical protein